MKALTTSSSLFLVCFALLIVERVACFVVIGSRPNLSVDDSVRHGFGRLGGGFGDVSRRNDAGETQRRKERRWVRQRSMWNGSHHYYYYSSSSSSSSPWSSSSLSSSSTSSSSSEDLFEAVHRKEYEMKAVSKRHSSTTDPVRMAMGYAQENASPMRLARALRRVYEDDTNPANPKARSLSDDERERRARMKDMLGMAEAGMRRGCFVADIKRRSLSRPGEVFCNYDDAGMVAEAMVRLGADAVFVNVDYRAYGGDLSELKSSVRAVRRVSDTAAVVMKDIVVDEIQLGLAKEAGADGVVLMASVLGPSLENFLDLATVVGLETIVECHTKNEVERAIELLAQNIMVTNYDRPNERYYPEQAIRLAGLFPGSGGPIITLAGGDIDTIDKMKKHLVVGYDGVVVGKAVMGSTRAPEFIRACRDRTLLPAELSQWGLEDVEFDSEGNVMNAVDEPTKRGAGKKKNVASPDDPDAFQ